MHLNELMHSRLSRNLNVHELNLIHQGTDFRN
jgi:hypothetical protein